MKLCDMCSPQSAENAETYEMRFDKLPTFDREVVEHLTLWRGEVCYRHAELIRVALEAGPPTKGTASPGNSDIERPADEDAALLKEVADWLSGALPFPFGLEGQERLDVAAVRLKDFAARLPVEA
jgi:hypothetical protein